MWNTAKISFSCGSRQCSAFRIEKYNIWHLSSFFLFYFIVIVNVIFLTTTGNLLRENSDLWEISRLAHHLNYPVQVPETTKMGNAKPCEIQIRDNAYILVNNLSRNWSKADCCTTGTVYSVQHFVRHGLTRGLTSSGNKMTTRKTLQFKSSRNERI